MERERERELSDDLAVVGRRGGGDTVGEGDHTRWRRRDAGIIREGGRMWLQEDGCVVAGVGRVC
jgi:hypothetical protein